MSTTNDDDPARIYLDSDHDARLAGEWREEADAVQGGMRLAGYVVLCAAMLVAGALVVAVVRMLGQ